MQSTTVWTHLAQAMESLSYSNIRCFQRNLMDLSSQHLINVKNFHLSQQIDIFLACFWDYFPFYIENCPIVLETSRTRNIIWDGRLYNTEHYLLAAHLTFFPMINRNLNATQHDKELQLLYIQISKSSH